ncbi:sensor histidine kinase [Sphaerisporangium aureirubrum]|uniref:histidine kinase n=1 Tax=Sphaerisporangium aureirubrum TaxID=1544736 RepID=A0ABW1NGN7_9ACTN
MQGSGGVPVARWRRLSTRAWFTVTLGSLAVLLAVSAGLMTWALSATSQATDQVTRQIFPGVLAFHRLRTALFDQEAGLHGYVLSGRPEFLEPYRRGVAEETASVARLRSALGGTGLIGGLDAVLRGAASWREDYAEPMAAAVAERGAGTVTPAQAARGKELFDGIRRALAAQERDLDRGQARAEAALETARLWRNLIVTAVLVVFVLTLVSVSILLRYTVLRPLDRLGTAARRAAGGDFGRGIDVRGPSDITALAAGVEAMRQRIATELTVSQEARRLLQEQTDLLSEQAAELRRSNSELEQFAYVASHDLQEPVRKVTAFCQLLQRRYAGQLDERADEYISFAVDGAKRMQTLISGLLTFSRVGRAHEEHVPVPLDRPLEAALANLDTLVEETGAVVARPALPEVVGDPGLLTMLWQNLIGNAVKFRVPGRAPQVRITVERAGKMWEVAVQDDGIGVEPRFADKIFVIFQRLHNREEYDGTGIGLALCKKIVEYHGGEIHLDTGVAEGSRFVFTLPVPDLTSPDPGTRTTATPRPAGQAIATVPQDPGP